MSATMTQTTQAVSPDETTVAAERMLIGSLLLDRDGIPVVAPRLTPAAFLSSECRAVYEVITDLFERRVPADVSAVWRASQRHPHPVDLLTLHTMATEVVETGYACHANHYADEIVSMARGRAIAAAGARLVRDANIDPDIDPATAFSDVLRSLPDLGATPERGLRYYRDIVPDFGERVMRTWSGERQRYETPTGFSALDRKLRGGFRPGELTLLGARPGMGKSALMLEFAHHAAREGHTALVFSAEMTTEALLWRAASEVTGLPLALAENGRDTDTAMRANRDRYLSLIHEQMAALPVAIDDTSRPTVAQMQVKIEAEQRRGPVGLVVFDYIELAGSPGRPESEERRVGRIGNDLKHLAMTCRVPVVALSQLSREVERRKTPVPQLSDLRYSGSLEADADVAMFLYRPGYYMDQGIIPDDEAERPFADVIIAKQRNGETGPVRLRFDGPSMTFSDLGV